MTMAWTPSSNYVKPLCTSLSTIFKKHKRHIDKFFFCIFLLILSLTLYLSNENTCITHYWSSSERILGSIWNTWTNVSKTIMQTHGKFHASASQAELYRGQTISQALDSNSSTLVVLFAAKSRLAQEFTGLVPQTQCNNRSKPNKLFGKNKY